VRRERAPGGRVRRAPRRARRVGREAAAPQTRHDTRRDRPDIKRELLERAVAADPDPAGFEEWLHEQCLAAGTGDGGVRAMALSIFEEWRLAQDATAFGEWLQRGAPSDDALSGEGSNTSR